MAKFTQATNKSGGLVGSDSASNAKQNAHVRKLVRGLLDELALVGLAKRDAKWLVIN